MNVRLTKLRDSLLFILFLVVFIDTLIFPLDDGALSFLSKLAIYPVAMCFAFVAGYVFFRENRCPYWFFLAIFFGLLCSVYLVFGVGYSVLWILVGFIAICSYLILPFDFGLVPGFVKYVNMLFWFAFSFNIYHTLFGGAAAGWSVISGMSVNQGAALGEFFVFRVSLFPYSLMKGAFFSLFVFTINLVVRRKLSFILAVSAYIVLFSFSRTVFFVFGFVVSYFWLIKNFSNSFAIKFYPFLYFSVVVFLSFYGFEFIVYFFGDSTIGQLFIKQDESVSTRALMSSELFYEVLKYFPAPVPNKVLELSGRSFSEIQFFLNIALYGVVGVVLLLVLVGTAFIPQFSYFFIFCLSIYVFYSSNFYIYGLSFVMSLFLTGLSKFHRRCY